MFEGVSYVETFKELSLASSMDAEDGGDDGGSGGGDGIPMRSEGPRRRSMDAQEQAYFESSEDGVVNVSESTEPPSASVALLAKYNDDELDLDDSTEWVDDSAVASPAADASLGAGRSAEGVAAAAAAATTLTSPERDADSAKHPRSPDSPELQPPKRARVDDGLSTSALDGSGGAAAPVKRKKKKKTSIVITLGAATTAAVNSAVGAGTVAAGGGTAMSKEASSGSSGSDDAKDGGGGEEPLQKRARIDPAL